jgi:glutamate synthase (NADPH/NADH) small chain
MSRKLLRFTDVAQAMPEKRPADQRAEDFAEIYRRFVVPKAEEQAGRCSQCGVPFCQVHCPLHNNIPDWLKLAAEDRLDEAYEVSQATNNMPEICGRICPQDRLCEKGCVIEQSGHGSVTIGAVEQFITEYAWENGIVPPLEPGPETGLSVAVIGAGPAGLAAAEELRKLGHSVTVYDRYDRRGGLLIYGIPNFKLEKTVVQRRVDRLEKGGIVFRDNFEVGRDASLADLRAQHDAVLVATGVYKARDLTCPGAGLPGIFPAMAYLTASNRTGLGDDVPEFADGTLNAEGKRVVVIGGGDTAMDCVRTAIRQGATQVTCLYRRDRPNMPGSQREVGHAEEEGVNFEWLAAPLAVLGDDKVEAVRAQRMRLGPPDPSGRRSPEPIDGDHFDVDADLVIKALGFQPEDLPHAFGERDLPVTPWGTLSVDDNTMMTGLPGVFAAGDIVRGASLVVWAIRDGRVAAEGIHAWLSDAGRMARAGDRPEAAPAAAE